LSWHHPNHPATKYVFLHLSKEKTGKDEKVGRANNVRTTKKTPGVLALEVNRSNIEVHYKMVWEDTMEDLQEIGEVNLPQFGRFLGMFSSLFCCGGGFEGGSNFVLSKKGQKETQNVKAFSYSRIWQSPHFLILLDSNQGNDEEAEKEQNGKDEDEDEDDDDDEGPRSHMSHHPTLPFCWSQVCVWFCLCVFLS